MTFTKSIDIETFLVFVNGPCHQYQGLRYSILPTLRQEMIQLHVCWYPWCYVELGCGIRLGPLEQFVNFVIIIIVVIAQQRFEERLVN